MCAATLFTGLEMNSFNESRGALFLSKHIIVITDNLSVSKMFPLCKLFDEDVKKVVGAGSLSPSTR